MFCLTGETHDRETAKEKGLYGRYFLIRKIDEDVWHPGHTVPMVYVKITDGITDKSIHWTLFGRRF